MTHPFDNTYMFSPKIKAFFIESKSWTVRWLAKQNRGQHVFQMYSFYFDHDNLGFGSLKSQNLYVSWKINLFFVFGLWDDIVRYSIYSQNYDDLMEVAEMTYILDLYVDGASSRPQVQQLRRRQWLISKFSLLMLPRMLKFFSE